MSASSYLVRYGLMRHVGVFSAAGPPLERGQQVVIESARGRELGEILATAPASMTAAPGVEPRIARSAGPDDLARARDAQADQPRILAACESIFSEGVWPLTLLDVEPLLDKGRAVIYYLGPHRLASEGLRQAIRERLSLDIVLEPVGRDEPEEEFSGTCGAAGCGGGGCGSQGSDHHGCDGCAVKDLIRTQTASVTV